MIAKPTTEQILNDCSRQLMEIVLPAVTDQTVQVAIFMMDLVLRNAAVRAAHEIAWMTDEIAELESFTGDPVGADRLASRRRRRALRPGQRGILESDGGSRRLPATRLARPRAPALLARRGAHEQEIMCGWSPVGR